ncbi:MAG: BrnA antitoxin family protein [Candidatus Entotheonellia bacterium]
MRTSKDNTTHFRLDPAHPPKLTPTQAKRLKAMPIDYSDIPELPDDFWTHNPPVARETKQQITLRLDSDVVEFFRAQGPYYQTRINAVLRTYVNSAMRSSAVPHVPQTKRRDPGADLKAAKASKPGNDGRGRAGRGPGRRHR